MLIPRSFAICVTLVLHIGAALCYAPAIETEIVEAFRANDTQRLTAAARSLQKPFAGKEDGLLLAARTVLQVAMRPEHNIQDPECFVTFMAQNWDELTGSNVRGDDLKWIQKRLEKWAPDLPNNKRVLGLVDHLQLKYIDKAPDAKNHFIAITDYLRRAPFHMHSPTLFRSLFFEGDELKIHQKYNGTSGDLWRMVLDSKIEDPFVQEVMDKLDKITPLSEADFSGMRAQDVADTKFHIASIRRALEAQQSKGLKSPDLAARIRFLGQAETKLASIIRPSGRYSIPSLCVGGARKVLDALLNLL